MKSSGSRGNYKGNYCGRSDYKGGGGSVDSPSLQGNKGIVSGLSSSGGATHKGGVESSTNGGNRGIPPAAPSGDKKAPLS